MTKKWSPEILARENRKMFLGKGQIRKICLASENFSQIGGKSETGRNALLPLGMDAPDDQLVNE